jgi:hypothetical protein
MEFDTFARTFAQHRIDDWKEHYLQYESFLALVRAVEIQRSPTRSQRDSYPKRESLDAPLVPPDAPGSLLSFSSSIIHPPVVLSYNCDNRVLQKPTAVCVPPRIGPHVPARLMISLTFLLSRYVA